MPRGWLSVVLAFAAVSFAPGCITGSGGNTGSLGSNSLPPKPSAASNQPAVVQSPTASPEMPATAMGKPSAASRFKKAMTENPLSLAIGGAAKKTSDWMKPGKSQQEEMDALSLANNGKTPGAELYVSMAKMAEARGELDQAAAQFDKAMEREPKNVAVMLEVARFRDRQNHLADAEALYRRAVEVEPKNAMAANDLGLCLARQGKLTDALPAINRAVQLEPTKKLYRNNIATVLVELDRNDEALSQLIHAHGPAAGYYNLGYLLQRKGNIEAAAVCFNKALEINPNMAEAQQWLARLQTMPANPVAARPEAHLTGHAQPVVGDRYTNLPTAPSPESAAPHDSPQQTPPSQDDRYGTGVAPSPDAANRYPQQPQGGGAQPLPPVTPAPGDRYAPGGRY